MKDRFKVVPSVYLLLKKDDRILLLRRCNSGYYDGYYSLPAGHVEAGETLTEGMVREAAEEIGVAIKKEDLRLAHVLYRMSNIPVPHERADFFFVADRWEGEPRNVELHKCDRCDWFSLPQLPSNTVPEVRHVIEQLRIGALYSEMWP